MAVRLGLGLVLALWASIVSAQPDVDARRVVVGAAGATCSVRAGSGVPSTSLGATCDVYVRTDSPYGVYHKLDSTTWVQSSPGTGATGDLYYGSSATAFGRLSAVATGQVLVSAGTGTAPAYSANPSVSTITATGSATGLIATSDNAQLRLIETDGAANNQWWVIRAQNEQFAIRALADDATGTSWLTAERTGSAVDNVTLSPSAGDIILAPGGSDILPDVGYTKNLGALTNKYLTLHAAELWVETLVAQDTLATIGGRILVGPTTTLTSDLASGATSMNVKHNNLANGDRVVMQANGSLEWMAVASSASGSGPYTYTITRNLDGSGANNWTAGDAVFNTGTTGNGFIDLYSLAGVIPGSTAGPTIVGNVRTGTTYSNIAPRWAIGNLNGLFGYGATAYGAAFGDPSATNITIDATNGIRIRNATTDKLTADTSGNLSIVGDLAVGTSGLIRSGATNYTTGTGYILDYNGGTPRLRIGTTAGNRVTWDGTNLTVVSANATIDSNGIALTPPSSFTDASAYRWSVSTGALAVYGQSTAAARGLRLDSTWTGTGNLSAGNSVYLGAFHQPSSGGTSNNATLEVLATGSLSSISMNTTRIVAFATETVEFDDLVVYSNNSTTTSVPSIRSDGNYLVINARSDANSGAIYLSQDNDARIHAGMTSGGTRGLYVYNEMRLNGLASCTLQVDGDGDVGCVSDAAAKTDIVPYASGLDSVARLRPVTYRWRDSADTSTRIGFIAQDVAPVIPEAVKLQTWNGGPSLTLDDRSIVAVLVNAVKELSAKVTALESRR